MSREIRSTQVGSLTHSASNSQREAQFLKVGDVAKYLHVHQSTVRRWSKTGLLNCVAVGTRRDRRFWKKDVDNLKEDLASFSRVGTQSIRDLTDSVKLESVMGLSYNASDHGLWRLREVARALGVHENTIRRWSNQGQLKPIRVGKRNDRLFHSDEVMDLMYKWSGGPETHDTDGVGSTGKRAGISRILPAG